MFNKSLTVVLPVYNGEMRLRKNVHEILELASELTSKFGVLIIDDGSNDATYEVAEELAARYPQVSVRRHRHRRGLGPTIDYVQRRVRSDAVIVHDGMTPINAGEMRSLWHCWIHQTVGGQNDTSASGSTRSEIRDLAKLPGLHAAMEKAHGRVIGFQLITPTASAEIQENDRAPTTTPLRTDDSIPPRRHVGRIPALPRPKFLTALAAFAMGE